MIDMTRGLICEYGKLYGWDEEGKFVPVTGPRGEPGQQGPPGLPDPRNREIPKRSEGQPGLLPTDDMIKEARRIRHDK